MRRCAPKLVGEPPLFVDCLRALVLRPQVLLESDRLREVDDRRPLFRADLQHLGKGRGSRSQMETRACLVHFHPLCSKSDQAHRRRASRRGSMDMLCCAPRSGPDLLARSGLSAYLQRVDEEYELRVIVWEVRGVATLQPLGVGDVATRLSGKHVSVRVQPRGKGDYGVQQTDDGPCNADGDAEFNWRMLWPMSVMDMEKPVAEKAPMLHIAVGNHGANGTIGEAELSLATICERAAIRRTGQFLDTWVTCTSPGNGPDMASVCITVEVLRATEAVLKPAGEGRSAPNSFPRLATPMRQKLFRPNSCPCL